MIRQIREVIVVIVLVLALGACGSDADMSTAETGSSETSTTATRSEVVDNETGETASVEPGKDAPADGVRRLWIKPDLVDCVGESLQTCMQVAEAEDGQYNYFYDQIEGFTFEEGTSYVVDVRVEEIEEPPADAGTLRYTLIAIVEN